MRPGSNDTNGPNRILLSPGRLPNVEGARPVQMTTSERGSAADPAARPCLRNVDRRGDLHVWIVNGSHVRGHIDEEFANFGQYYQ